MEHPFTIAGQQIEHHAMPCFLYRKNYFGFKKEEIETPYNLVKISWIVHVIMHRI